MEQPQITRRERRFYKPTRPSTITIPKRASSHVKLVFTEMHRQRITYDMLEQKSGVLRTTVKAWRHKNKPGLESIEAALGVLGFDFVPIPREKTLPPELVAELRPIAERFEMTMQGTTEALIALIAGIHKRLSPADAAPSTAPKLTELAS